MKFQALTNVRPVKDHGTQLIVSCVNGQIKITPKLAELLGVMATDTVTVVKSEGKFYVAKGTDKLGGKLASSNEGGGGVLSFSAQVAWETLNGDTEHNTHYNVSEEGITDEESGLTFYELIFEEKIEKSGRGTGRKPKTAKVEETGDRAVTPSSIDESEGSLAESEEEAISDFDDM